jgi:predicted small metal-binding protein
MVENRDRDLEKKQGTQQQRGEQTRQSSERINPSGPTTGTEGYGLGAGERGNIGGSNPTNVSPGREGGGNLRESQSEMRNETARRDVRSEASSASPRGERSFRCADVGFADCRWEVSGRSEEELMPQIERHGRDAHGITSLDEGTRRRVRDAIRERAA